MQSHNMQNQDMQSQNMPRSQKQQHQLQSILEYNLANEETYYTSDEEAYYTNDEEEEPTPTWNLPNWKGNREEPNIHDKCTGCITDVRNGEIRGCKDCDEFWDLPELEEMAMPMSDCEAVQIINIHNVFVGEGKI